MTRDTIVVTGASGFVGRHLVEGLRALGSRIVAAGREPDRMPEGVEHVPLDLEAPAGLPPDVLQRATAVCHFATFIPPDYGASTFAERCLRVNALGTLRLLEQSAASEVPSFINCSSGNLYGPQNRLVREDDPVCPSPRAAYYLSSKLVQDVYAQQIALRTSLRVVTLRPSAIYGPGMVQSGLLPTFASRLRRGESIEVQDGGRYGVDFVFVADVVQATLAALERDVAGIFNVGSGLRTTTLELATALVDALGADPTLVEVQPAGPLSAGGFSGLDVSRARDELGYIPTPLSEGLVPYLEAGS